MGKEVVFKLDNCMDCPHHRVYADPDPDDWFVMMTKKWCVVWQTGI